MILISFELSNATSVLTEPSVSALYDTITALKNSLFSMHPSGSQYFSIYDTAYLSLIKDDLGKPVFSNSLTPLLNNLNVDLLNQVCSWGNPHILSDSILSTLASIYALKQSHRRAERYTQRLIDNAELFIYKNYTKIAEESYFTAGFEFLVPNLLEKAEIDLLDHPITHKLQKYQQAKLSKIPLEYIQTHKTPLLFALEGLDSCGITPKLDHFVEANGSIATAPSTTAWYITHNPDSDKLPDMASYLINQYNPKTGGVPSFADYSLMNIPFVLYPLYKAGIYSDRFTPLLDYVREHWTQTGVGHSTYFPMTDADDTAVSLLLMNKYYQIPDNAEQFDSLLAYKKENYFVTYPWENGASNMVNLHVLDMILETNIRRYNPEFNSDYLVSYISHQITQQDGIGGDKYHYSPYCQNSHGVLALTKHYPQLSAKLIDWFLRNQDEQGLWGMNGPTVEETAYAVLALSYYHLHAKKLDLASLNNAVDYLIANDQPYPNLWLSKVAYTPIETVQAHILAALELYHKATQQVA